MQIPTTVLLRITCNQPTMKKLWNFSPNSIKYSTKRHFLNKLKKILHFTYVTVYI